MSAFERFMTVLRRALELPESQRSEFVNAQCKHQPHLRAELQSILEQVDRVPAVLATGGAANALGSPHDLEEAASSVGDIQHVTIPGYSILGRIGAGGMGVVYEAEQQAPRRRVALKFMRLGPHTTAIQMRLFEREAQALAMLRHPSIAALYEFGNTPSGEQYFAMELVQGHALNAFVRRLPLTGSNARHHLKQRLRIFVKIVDAVSYAHQRGVVHRDIKPSNVLVAERRVAGDTSRDSSREAIEVKLLDFGLARILDGDPNGSTLLTSAGAVLGTLAYMSPEQARGDRDSIDARSDVYSLGVVLYELLTDRLPVDVDGVLVHEAVRRVCHAEPRRAGSLRPSLRGDLETIAAKAIDKDPDQRYPTAAALADDIQRYLENQPVLARPLSAAYQLRKLVSRYRIQAAFAFTVATLIMASAVTTTILWQRQRRERQRAERAELDQRDQLWQASMQHARAARLSGRAGRRFDALGALGRAARIRPSLELRQEAIAAMALVDLRLVRSIQYDLTSGNANIGMDGSLERFIDPQQDGGIVVRDGATGRVQFESPGDGGPVGYCRMGSAGRYVAVKHIAPGDDVPLDDRFTFRLYDVARGEMVLEFPTWAGLQMDLSPDEALLAVNGRSRTDISLYHLVGDSAPRQLAAWPTIELFSVRFSPSGDRLALAGAGLEVREVASGRTLWKHKTDGFVFDVHWSDDGTRLAAGCSNRLVHTFDARTGANIQTFEGHQAEVTRTSYDASSRWVLSSGWDGTTRVWDPKRGSEVIRTRGVLVGAARTNNRVATQQGRTLEIWALEAERGFREYHGHDFAEKRYGTVDFSSDQRYVVSAGWDGVRVWGVGTAEAALQIQSGNTYAALFSEGKRLEILTAGTEGLKRWPIRDAATGPELDPPIVVAAQLRDLVWCSRPASDGRVAVLDVKGRVTVVDPHDLERKTVLPSVSNARFVALSPSGEWVAVSGWRHSVAILDVDQRSVATELPMHAGGVGVGIHPTGAWLVTVDSHEAVVWETQTWSRHATISRGPNPRYATGRAAVSPDGRFAAITATRSMVRLISLPDALELATLEAPHEGTVSQLHFAADGRKLAVGYETKPVVVWDLDEVRAGLRELGLDWSLPTTGDLKTEQGGP